jgi:hypothetical protein
MPGSSSATRIEMGFIAAVRRFRRQRGWGTGRSVGSVVRTRKLSRVSNNAKAYALVPNRLLCATGSN